MARAGGGAGVAAPWRLAGAARWRPAGAAGRTPQTRATDQARAIVSLEFLPSRDKRGSACSDPTYTGKAALGSAGPRLATFRRLPARYLADTVHVRKRSRDETFIGHRRGLRQYR